MSIIGTAFVVAVLDGLFPMALYLSRLHGAVAQRVMQSIAAGLLGPAAYQGGWSTTLLGMALHFCIAVIWTAGYVFAVSRLRPVRRLSRSQSGTLLTAAIYGACIWLWMNYVVIALSRATVASAAHWPFWSQLVWHMVGVGPAIVLLSEKRRRKEAVGAGNLPRQFAR